MSKKINPIIKPVVEAFQTAYYQTLNFANNPNSAINGMLVMGDAGTGKSHWVKKALRDANVQQNVEYIKGGTITAASLYVKLYLNRFSHRILVLDDVDIINHPEKSKIVPLILGAVEEGKDRLCSWNTAKKNALMEEFNVPFDFAFNGNIIVITNYTMDRIGEKLAQWKQAFSSRFNGVSCVFNHEQKYMYTKHLVENEMMLTDNCKVHTYTIDEVKYNGYPQHIVDETMDYIDDNYMYFSDITPRVAVKVADTIYYNTDPMMKRVMLANLKAGV
tara:strand:+ start:3645 stop:4469 length:825 start_codon:yes stop_codon:yes gene_type:complete